MTKNYTDLSRLRTFEERYKYLRLRGNVGRETFGFDRYINQKFYASRQWRHVRNYVIDRDMGCDLGIQGHEIFARLLIHHMEPITADEVAQGHEALLDPEFLITTTHRTHNAIHYGDVSQLVQPVRERRRGDTKLW